MLKFSKLTLLSALLAFSAGSQAADDETIRFLGGGKATEKSAAQVNGVSIPQARVDFHVKIAVQQGQPESPELRKDVREKLIQLEVVSQAATKAGLDKQPETMQQMEIARQNILAGAFIQDYVKNHPIADDVLKQVYDAEKARLGNKEYKLSHILVETEEDAKKIAADLKKKDAKFAKIAKAKSKDPGSKDNGGDLGWTSPSNFVQPFADAVIKLEKGQISDLVKTQYGWHIIKLEDIREMKVPTFDEVKQNIAKGLQQQVVKKAIDEMVGKAKIDKID